MKIIDIYNKIANGEKVPCFKINGEKYGLGEDGYLREFFGNDVKWYIYEHWLNEEVEVLEEVEDKEYEDIEEFKEHKLINTRDILELEMIINKINADYNYKINTLIRNQKYILEQLNKEGK